MKKIILLFLFSPLMGWAQDKGTHFEHGLNWQQVKEKAKRENKYLLVDCFTTWCGPCKQMSSNVFPQEKVGAFFNKNFVNLKIQFDQTSNDSEEVKSWYADAKHIEKTYGVRAYPTFLIFSPDGNLVHRIVGGSSAEGFIKKAEKALHPETQYYTLLKQYESGNASPEQLKKLASLSLESYDLPKADSLSEAYLKTQTDQYSKENLEFMSQFISDTKSKGFQMILSEAEKAEAVLGKDKMNKILSNAIMQGEIYPRLTSASVNLDSLITLVKSKYPTVDLDKPASFLKVQFYKKNKQWTKFRPAAVAYMEKYGKEVTASTLNDFAWAVFENCEDPDCIGTAITWSKRTVDETQFKDPGLIDTYANLLYKSGKKQEAIELEQKALDLALNSEKSTYQVTLDKMKKGEKTWTK